MSGKRLGFGGYDDEWVVGIYDGEVDGFHPGRGRGEIEGEVCLLVLKKSHNARPVAVFIIRTPSAVWWLHHLVPVHSLHVTLVFHSSPYIISPGEMYSNKP